MALTASRTTAGFEPINNIYLNTVPPPTKYELAPNTAFSKGDAVVITNGKIAKAAAGATNVVGVMAEAFTTTTNATADTVFGRVYDHPGNIYLCSFADHTDSTATGGTTTTLLDTALSQSTDDYWNGALLYCYEGTNAGYLATVKDYTGSTDTLTFEKAAPASFDTTSKYIMLGYGTGGTANVINLGSIGVDLKDENTIDANATIGSEAGPMVVMPMGPNAVDLIKDLMMLVMFRKQIFSTP